MSALPAAVLEATSTCKEWFIEDPYSGTNGRKAQIAEARSGTTLISKK
jgi:hypothetical protein